MQIVLPCMKAHDGGVNFQQLASRRFEALVQDSKEPAVTVMAVGRGFYPEGSCLL